jgi:hypothetical protein
MQLAGTAAAADELYALRQRYGDGSFPKIRNGVCLMRYALTVQPSGRNIGLDSKRSFGRSKFTKQKGRELSDDYGVHQYRTR